MLAAGAAEGNGQVALAFVNVVRKKIDQQIGDPLNEFGCLGKRPYVLSHFRVASGQRAKLRNKVWIGQEANVEDQVGIVGHALLESKTHAGNQDVSAVFLFLEKLDDV